MLIFSLNKFRQQVSSTDLKEKLDQEVACNVSDLGLSPATSRVQGDGMELGEIIASRVANATKVLQARIHKFVNTWVFSKSLLASNIVE